jgi:hypothetical protein
MLTRILALGATTLLILFAVLLTNVSILSGQPAVAVGLADGSVRKVFAPVAVSGDNIYVAWWTNKTGNDEVMFRMSTDAGKTFGDKINLSNSPKSNSQDVQLSEDEGKVVITWWERNATINAPVMRVSTDNGKTFGDLINLSPNGKIG